MLSVTVSYVSVLKTCSSNIFSSNIEFLSGYIVLNGCQDGLWSDNVILRVTSSHTGLSNHFCSIFVLVELSWFKSSKSVRDVFSAHCDILLIALSELFSSHH